MSQYLLHTHNSIHGSDNGMTEVSDTAPLPVSVSQAQDQVIVGGVQVAPSYAAISGATSGNNTLVTAVTSKKIRVLAMQLVAANSVTIAIQDGAGGTALTGVMSAITGVPITFPYNPLGWFQGSVATLLNMSLGGNVQVSGSITYVAA